MGGRGRRTEIEVARPREPVEGCCCGGGLEGGASKDEEESAVDEGMGSEGGSC